MSRHTLPSKDPNREIVVGFDRKLRHWFGSVYEVNADPRADEKVLDGWPNKDGLIGPFNMPMRFKDDAVRKMKIFLTWLDKQPHGMSREQLVQLENTLWGEYHGAIDANYAKSW